MTFSSCRVLNLNMEDSTGMIRVSAFDSLSDDMNRIFKVLLNTFVLLKYYKHFD